MGYFRPNTTTTDVESFCLFANRQIVFAVNHRFAVSNPALLSAPSKKSFSKVNSPILACSAFTSIDGAAAAVPVPGPNTLAAPVQVFGCRHDGLSTRCCDRRPKSAKARNRGGLGTLRC